MGGGKQPWQQYWHHSNKCQVPTWVPKAMVNCHQPGGALRRLLWGLYFWTTLVLIAQGRAKMWVVRPLQKMAEGLCLVAWLHQKSRKWKEPKGSWGQKTPECTKVPLFYHPSWISPPFSVITSLKLTKCLFVTGIASINFFSKNYSMSEAHNNNIEKKPDIYILYDFNDIQF